MAVCEVGLDLPGLASLSRSPAPSGWLTVDQGTLLGWMHLSVTR